MKNILITSILICLLGLSMSCSEKKDSQIIGVWKLTTRTINIPFDVNNDGLYNNNLIEEVECNPIETLTFDNNGTVYSGNELSSELTFFKQTNPVTYGINVTCDESAIISFASEFNIISTDTIQISARNYIVNDTTLATIFENAVEIFNKDFTEILETRDLTLIYSKQ